jgi:hypothetical protein
LILANVALTPNFADADNFRNILVQVTPTMLVAIGMTFVIATGGIDLSVGSLMAIASAVAAISLDYGAYPAMLAALVVVTLTGAFNGWLISTFKIQPIIVTLALLIAGRGIAQVISNGGQLIPFSNPSFEFWGKRFALWRFARADFGDGFNCRAGDFRSARDGFRAARHRRWRQRKRGAAIGNLGQPHENNGLRFERTARGNCRFDLHGSFGRVGCVPSRADD